MKEPRLIKLVPPSKQESRLADHSDPLLHSLPLCLPEKELSPCVGYPQKSFCPRPSSHVQTGKGKSHQD